MIDKILSEIKENIINIRREIHRNPELAFEEYNTSKICADYLKGLGMEVTTNVAKTGVVGLLKGNGEGKTLLLRADIDALPMKEETDLDYSSQNEGVMHGCGHDVHTAILLAAATVLTSLKDSFKGNVKFVFQPAEEGNGGALPMIEEGVLENPYVDGALAYHIWDTIPTGSVLIKEGGTMASPDHFFINITGKGGHGAKPENCINPVQIAAEMITKLHEIKTEGESVISICAVNSGVFENTIPDTAELKGTARTTDPKTRKEMHDKISEIVKTTAEKYGGTAELDYRFLYPPCVNDSQMTKAFSKTVKRVLGEGKVITQEKCDMTGEDFSYFAEAVPSCFVKLGGALKPLHTSDFLVNEDAIFIGAKLMVEFALDFLKGDFN